MKKIMRKMMIYGCCTALCIHSPIKPVILNATTIDTSDDEEIGEDSIDTSENIKEDTINIIEKTKKPKPTKEAVIPEPAVQQPVSHEVYDIPDVPQVEKETPVPKEEPTPEPTEEPTPEPTEEPTPTPIPVTENEVMTIIGTAPVGNSVTRLEIFYSLASDFTSFKITDANGTEMELPNYLSEELIEDTLKLSENNISVQSNVSSAAVNETVSGAAIENNENINYYITGTSYEGQQIRVYPQNLVEGYSDVMYTVIYISSPNNPGTWTCEIPDSINTQEFLIVNSSIPENWENETEIYKTTPLEISYQYIGENSKYLVSNVERIIEADDISPEPTPTTYDEKEAENEKKNFNVIPFIVLIIIIVIIVALVKMVLNKRREKQLDILERQEAAERRRNRKKKYTEEEEMERLTQGMSELEADEDYTDDDYENDVAGKKDNSDNDYSDNDYSDDDYSDDDYSDDIPDNENEANILNKVVDPYSFIDDMVEEDEEEDTNVTPISNNENEEKLQEDTKPAFLSKSSSSKKPRGLV